MKTFILANPAVRRKAADYIMREAPDGYVIAIDEPRRNLDQNARLHAMLSDVAKQVQWAGKTRSVDVWKRLVTAAWLRAEKEHVEMLPAIDGHGVDIIFERTSRMSKRQVSSMTEYLFAWGAEHEIVWSEPEPL